MMTQPYNQYLNTQLNTASPGDLTLMLMNGGIRFMKQAQLAIEKRDIESKHNNLTKAMNILEELQSTLKMEYEISHNLYNLYDYMMRLLVQANVKLDQEALAECLALFTDLKDTWAQAVKLAKQSNQVASS